MFGHQRGRLLREDPWPTAQALAEELYAMFQDDIPLSHDGPLSLTVPDGGIVLKGAENGDTIFSIQRGTLPPFNLILQDGSLQPESGTPQESAPARSSTFPGRVQSGSGNTYQVNIYPNGLAAPPRSVSVRQIQIADDSPPIPQNTGVLVTQAQDGRYYMQVPVYVG